MVRDHADDILLAADDSPIPEELLTELTAAVDGLYWYDRKILELYAKNDSMRNLSAETGIPLVSIHDTIKSARKAVKRKMKGHA